MWQGHVLVGLRKNATKNKLQVEELYDRFSGRYIGDDGTPHWQVLDKAKLKKGANPETEGKSDLPATGPRAAIEGSIGRGQVELTDDSSTVRLLGELSPWAGSVCLIYVVTIAIFPALTSTIVAVPPANASGVPSDAQRTAPIQFDEMPLGAMGFIPDPGHPDVLEPRWYRR